MIVQTPTDQQAMTNERTVRELGGEIWHEIRKRIPEEDVNWEKKEKLTELIMAVLARHVGATIANDRDLPVEPLGD
jgi:hypothetical protein